MDVLFATSELAPFAKTGGLADVSAALPAALSELGHTSAVIMPAYREAIECGQQNKRLDVRFEVPIGGRLAAGRALESRLPNSDVPVYLVEQDDYFDRPHLYGEPDHDYKDNCERFTFFCRAVIELIRLLDLKVDVLHCNDWQTGLIPAYLNIEHRTRGEYQDVACILTIHNIAYQGQFWHWDMLITGLDWKYFNWRQMEFWGKLNFLKTGLVFADAINTVSPRYAAEIQAAPLGCGLENVVAHRQNVLGGILNGVDYSIWNPITDPHLTTNYGDSDWQIGKAACKRALGDCLGLPVSPDVPLIGMIGRLADQKGVDLVASVLDQWLRSEDAQWVVLGRGDTNYMELFRAQAQQHPNRIAASMEFSDQLAHQIEAGADIFLMPSRFEPCGLNQLYSLKYGTVPVVRATGGLVDTIVDVNEKTVSDGTATGFQFQPYRPSSLDEALRRATTAFRQPQIWEMIVQNGMRQDWSWTRSAQEYVRFYRNILAKRKQAVCT